MKIPHYYTTSFCLMALEDLGCSSFMLLYPESSPVLNTLRMHGVPKQPLMEEQLTKRLIGISHRQQ